MNKKEEEKNRILIEIIGKVYGSFDLFDFVFFFLPIFRYNEKYDMKKKKRNK